jgi:hypothetical protein
VPTVLEIRKAFEVVVKDTIDAYDIAVSIAWPNKTFDPGDSVKLYVRPTLHPEAEIPKTLGPGPRVHREGMYKIGCFLRAGEGQDRLDHLAETLKEAYPYDTEDLVAGGRMIQIDRKSVGGLLTPPGWAFVPVTINWSIGI